MKWVRIRAIKTWSISLSSPSRDVNCLCHMKRPGKQLAPYFDLVLCCHLQHGNIRDGPHPLIKDAIFITLLWCLNFTLVLMYTFFCSYITISFSNVAVKSSSGNHDSSNTMSLCVDWLNAYFQGTVSNSDMPLPPICHLSIPGKTGSQICIIMVLLIT